MTNTIKFRINCAKAAVLYWRYRAWGGVASAASAVSIPFEKVADAAHDRWILDGRSWERFCIKEFPSEDRNPWFTSDQPDAPKTRKERAK
ncbi:MAG: hypothetical protein WC054_00505 [Candidatus Nanopelagicales bacterium]